MSEVASRTVSGVSASEVHTPRSFQSRRSRRAIEDLERELKLTVPAGRAHAVRSWVSAICARDDQHPEAVVWTVYYDTPDLVALDEKRNSDYLKMKIRARWYAPAGQSADGPAFVEAKFRTGSRREKARVELPWSASDLSARALDDPIFATIPNQLAAEGLVPGPAWQPLLKLRYRRTRFIEPASRTRISVDDDIAVTEVNLRRLAPINLGPLPVTVIEVKGEHDDLPLRLMPLLHLGARRTSYSKYAAVYTHVRRLVC